MTQNRKWGLKGLTRHPQLKRFFYGSGAQAEPYLTNGKNVYILPTRSGIAFAVILLVMLVGAINYNNSLGYLFTFFLASISVVAILHTYKNVLRLKFQLGKPRSVFCGDTVSIPVYIEQHQSVNRYALSLEFEPSLNASDKDSLKDIFALKEKIELPLLTQKRGLMNVPRFTLASNFPLGLFRSWAHIHLSQTFIVYPTPAPHPPENPATHYRPDQEGDQGKGTDDFAGLRNYHSGDSLRHIHWKAFAKTGAMITKQFGGDRSDECWLDWDNLPDTTVENRLSILTRWLLDADNAGLTFGLKLPNTIIKPASGPGHRTQCLETLALFGL